jgi:dTDP-4-amino-4,6-dideoxygalactose transaminase
MSDWHTVEKFESALAEFYGARYAVSTDCCTHAVELCLRLVKPEIAYCPTNTYISIPMTFEKLNLTWYFENIPWKDYYKICSSGIYDAAVLWKENSYISGSLMCVSFQHRKHLSLGRGGAILCDNKKDHDILKKLSYDGRIPNTPWAEQNFTMLGYHYYMTPETAELGLKKLEKAKVSEPKIWTDRDYPDLSGMEIFRGKNVK